MAYSLDNQLGVIRARVEAELHRPSVVTVTSAMKGDGKTMIALGVAEAMAKSGYRVLVIDAASISLPKRILAAEIDDVLGLIRPGDRSEPDYIALSALTPPSGAFSLQTLRAMFAWFRESYDYCFVDTNPAFGSPLSMSLAAAADSVIVALRYGRAASEVDRELVAALAATKSTILGVVTTNASAIEAFNRIERAKPPKGDRFARRNAPIATVKVSPERAAR